MHQYRCSHAAMCNVLHPRHPGELFILPLQLFQLLLQALQELPLLLPDRACQTTSSFDNSKHYYTIYIYDLFLLFHVFYTYTYSLLIPSHLSYCQSAVAEVHHLIQLSLLRALRAVDVPVGHSGPGELAAGRQAAGVEEDRGHGLASQLSYIKQLYEIYKAT